MLKRDITYEDFDGNSVTETFYFNLTRMEIVEMQLGPAEGFQALLERIIAEQDNKALFEQFQNIILISYGVRSEDGKRFIKNDEVREEFKQTAAYDALLSELMFSVDALVIFIQGVVPKDLAEEFIKQSNMVDVPLPPLPPLPPPAA